MNILLLAKNDWAGWGFAMSKAVNATTEHESRMIDFGADYYTRYPHDIHNPDVKTLGDWCDWSDVIVAFDDGDLMIPIDRDWKPVLQVYHGSWFRARPERIVTRAKRRGYITACTTHDLTKWGSEWLPVAVEDMSSTWQPGDKFIVAHAPTKRNVRGTEKLEKACKAVGIDLDIIEGVSHAECIQRKARANLVVDSTSDGLGISYGVNSVEAWALGIPVINHSSPEVLNLINMEIPFCDDGNLEDMLVKFRDNKAFYAKWQERGRKAWKEFHKPDKAARRFISKVEQTVSEATKPKPLSISVTMIVKDEEKVLQTALDSTKGLADEVVIVDTGSTDKTIDIAKKFGAKVITGGDRMNKGGERNHAIKEASGDWVVILDADEKIAEPEKVWHHIQMTYFDGLMPRTTYMSGDKEGLSFNQQRAWRKGAYWYKYHAHELPLPAEEGVIAEHVPYVWEHRPPDDRWGWKTEYTLNRILLDVEEYPDDARPLYYLGRQYRYMSGIKDYKDRQEEFEDKAIATLEKYVDMVKDKNAWDLPNAYYDLALLYARRKQYTNRLIALHNACRVQPSNKRWWFELAQCYWETGARELALGLAKVALELPSEKQAGYKIPELDGAAIYDRLGLWCWQMQRLQEGREYVKEALARAPKSEQLIKNLAYFDKALKEGGGNGNI